MKTETSLSHRLHYRLEAEFFFCFGNGNFILFRDKMGQKSTQQTSYSMYFSLNAFYKYDTYAVMLIPVGDWVHAYMESLKGFKRWQ